jgi:hypothetical protein
VDRRGAPRGDGGSHARGASCAAGLNL